MQEWHILGFGAIGQLHAHLLIQSGAKVTVIHSTHSQGVELNQGYFNFEDLQGKIYHHAIQFLNPAQSTAANIPIKNLLICTKANQTLSAVQGIKHLIDNSSHLLLLQNGFGIHEALQDDLQRSDIKPSIYIASTTHGAYRQSALHCQHTGEGFTQFGSWQSQEQNTPPPFLFSHIATYTPDILKVIWEKLLLSSAINALTVKHDCLNGGLLHSSDALADIQHVLSESCLIAIKMAPSMFDGHDEVTLYTALYQKVLSVIKATAENSSSMREDIKHHRETEIHYINGYLIKSARKHGLMAKQNAILVQLITQITRRDSINDK